MKTSNKLFASVLALSILSLGATGMAHAWGGKGGGCGRGGDMMQMAQTLDLSSEQRDAIRAIRDQQRDSMRAKRDQMMDIRQSLRALVHSDSFDAAKVRELADAKAKIQAEITVQRAETMHKIRGELNPEQTAKFDSMKGRGWGRGEFKQSGYGPGSF